MLQYTSGEAQAMQEWEARDGDAIFAAMEKYSCMLGMAFQAQPGERVLITPHQCSVMKPNKLIDSPEWTVTDTCLGLFLVWALA